MNITIFNWRDIKNSWTGGSELYIHELAKRWQKEGNSVSILTAEDPVKKLPKKEIIDGITVYRKGGRFSVYFWAPLVYLTTLRKQTDVIIDIENGIPFFTPLFSLKKKIAIVYHVHGKQFFYELPLPLSVIGFFLEKYVFPILYTNVPIISISKSSKAELVKLGFPSSHIHIVTPGVQYVSNGKHEKYKKPTILYLGRIKKYKRLDLLIDMFPKILKKVPTVKLIIAGWGTEGLRIIDVVMKNSYRRHVDILGPVSESEKRILLRRSWLMINPSLHEGWGISVTEANLYGTPAVAFKVPGLSDAIVNLKTGFLCVNQDEFVTRVYELIRQKSLRDKMGKQAQQLARKLTWEKAAKNSLRIIKSVYFGKEK